MKEEIRQIKEKCLDVLADNRLDNITYHSSASSRMPDSELSITQEAATLIVRKKSTRLDYLLNFNEEALYKNGNRVGEAVQYRAFLKAMAAALDGRDRYTITGSGQRKPL